METLTEIKSSYGSCLPFMRYTRKLTSMIVILGDIVSYHDFYVCWACVLKIMWNYEISCLKRSAFQIHIKEIYIEGS